MKLFGKRLWYATGISSLPSYSVYLTFLAELLQTIFQSAGVYAQLIIVYLPPGDATLDLLTYGMPIMSVIISVAVQLFYAWRIHIISGKRLGYLAIMIALVRN